MEEEKTPPMLLQLWFGEAAGRVQRGASERLIKWCEAFEGWLEELKQQYKPSTHEQAVSAWKLLARSSGKMPWEMETADIEQHAAWMREEGYAPNTIYNALGMLANFYWWCDERRIDAEAPARFNPAAVAQRPKIERYAGATLWSRGEVERLLGVLERDKSPLGLRERAFLMGRLQTGVPLISLQRLRWGQIEVDVEGAWVRWRTEGERRGLPEEVWQAIRAYLEASGRLGGMRAETFIFAPLLDSLTGGVGNDREEWGEERCLSMHDLLMNLKLYGRLARIAEEKLTLRALRRTATRLRLDEGGSVEEMQAFLDSRENVRATKYRLGKLPQLPEEDERELASEGEYPVPVRACRSPKPGEYIKHGMCAKKLPEQEVAAVLAEGVVGLEEEIVGMRTLERLLIERQTQAESRGERMGLMEACSKAAYWMGELIKAERQLKKPEEGDNWAEEFLEVLSNAAKSRGEELDVEALRAEALGGEPELNAAARQLTEEIATSRLVLRNAFRLAVESKDTRELVRLTDLYGNGCVRLVKLLKAEGGEEGKLEAYLKRGIDQAIEAVTEEWGLRGE